MPEINSIPYESAEDLNRFLYDNYQTTETLDLTVTGAGYLRNKLFELGQETGVTQNSICQTNYNYNYFNPLYAEAVWKCYMNNMDDCFVFFGFKETAAAPTSDMIESHSGFMVEDGKLFSSVADGTTQQKVEIVGIDLTRVENYKINYNRFAIQPLPEIEETLGIPGVLTTFPSIKRGWNEMVVLSNYPPINQVHYIVQYIRNTTNVDKRIIFNRFIYKEVYAD